MASTAPPNATNPLNQIATVICAAGWLTPPKAHPRWGYRRAHAVLHRDGHACNRKKVQRLWREEGLRVPLRRRKRRRVGTSTRPADRLHADFPDHVWALDYQYDVTTTGRTVKILHVVDEHNRESLADVVAYSINADATVTVSTRSPQTAAATRGPSAATTDPS